MLTSPKRSALVSWLIHAGAILLILAVTGVKPQLIPQLHEFLMVPADLAAYKQPASNTGGGGGGGARAETPASRGDRPEFSHRQFVVPTVERPTTMPILPMAATLIGDPEIKPATFNYQQYGLPDGVLGAASAGPGRNGGIGTGDHNGMGPGHGPGFGPGDDGGEGGGAVGYMGIGGGAVTPPSLLFKAEPEYSEEARKARLQGTVLLRIEVDLHGQPQHVSVRQSLGLGLDERAIEAVKKWKFTAGKVNGKPAVVEAYVEVRFRLL